MASNYRNSAGTDLDNLFYVNNSNLGAIGFKTSDGVDLGNRYANGEVLSYNVGYKNSAGTDIGYLRGKLVDFVLQMYVGDDGTSGYRDRGYVGGSYGSISQVSGTSGMVSKILSFFTARGGMYLYFNYSTPWTRIHVTNYSSGYQYDMTGGGGGFHLAIDNGNYMPGSGSTVRFRLICE